LSLDDFYIIGIQAKKKGNMDIYNKLLVEMFGKKLSWKEVKNLPRNDQARLMIKLKEKITTHESEFDIKKLARAIQNSRGGAGGCAITSYKCNFCGSEESWGNTAVPNICYNCAGDMASNIVLYEMDIKK
jgi:hypothetical protein